MDEKRKLTKRVVDALKPANRPTYFWDSEISGFGVKVATTGRKTYVFKYRTGGGRAGRSREPAIGVHGNLTPDQARDIARHWAAQIAAGGDPSGSRTAKRAAPTVSDLLDRYIAEHVRKKNKKSTQASAVQLVENVIRPTFGRLKAEDIKRADVAKFHSGLSGTPYQANRALAALSKALSLAEVWGMRPEQSNPCRRIQRFKEEARERLVLPDEFARLGAALVRAEREALPVCLPNGKTRYTLVNPQAILAFRLLILTGARVGEVLGLRWEHVDLATGHVRLSDSKTGKKSLYFAAPVLEILSTLIRPANGKGYIVRGGKGDDPEIRLTNLKAPWEVIRQTAGLDGLRLHDLRHGYASKGVASGLSLPVIGALLGHQDVKTTARYAHFAANPLHEAADQITGQIAAEMSSSSAKVIPFRR